MQLALYSYDQLKSHIMLHRHHRYAWQASLPHVRRSTIIPMKLIDKWSISSCDITHMLTLTYMILYSSMVQIYFQSSLSTQVEMVMLVTNCIEMIFTLTKIERNLSYSSKFPLLLRNDKAESIQLHRNDIHFHPKCVR